MRNNTHSKFKFKNIKVQVKETVCVPTMVLQYKLDTSKKQAGWMSKWVSTPVTSQVIES